MHEPIHLWIVYSMSIKGIVHQKMKMTLSPQAILGAYDFLLSDEYSQSYMSWPFQAL